MKLPFKIPSIKLPKLPKLPKFPKFGKKKADDDEDEDDFEDFEGLGDSEDAGDAADAPEPSEDSSEEAVAPEEAPADAPPEDAGDAPASEDMPDGEDAPASDDPDDGEMPDFGDDDEDDDDDEEGGGAKKKKRLMMIGGGVLVTVLLAGGGAWYFMSGDDGDATAGGPKLREGIDPNVSRVELDIAPKRRKTGGLNAVAAGATGPGAGVVAAAVSETAFASLPQPVTTDTALAVANDPSLLEDSPQGMLPRIAEDGRKPWQVYARPFTAVEGERRLGLIVAGLGLSRSATEAAIQLLPGNVTLAFSPYADGLEEWAAMARAAGHEVLMMVPLESSTFPYQDPGPQGLTTTNAPEENQFRLEFILSRMKGFVGVLTTMGSKFAESDEHLGTFLADINNRGLLLVEGKGEASTLAVTVAAELKLPRAAIDVVLDTIPSKSAIDRGFGEIEEIITTSSVGLGMVAPYPVSIERVIAWIAALKEKKIAIAPVSAIVGRQPVK